MAPVQERVLARALSRRQKSVGVRVRVRVREWVPEQAAPVVEMGD
jgi:hypothetical protein